MRMVIVGVCWLPAWDPPGPETGQARVLRGGDWAYGAAGCRSAFRSNSYPDNRYFYTGMRPLRTMNRWPGKAGSHE